jgi:hypothetical protein
VLIHEITIDNEKTFISYLVIKENEIVKNDIKCLFEGKTRRCLMGSTVSRACVGLAQITMRPTKSNHPKTFSWFIANICGTRLLGILSKGLIVFIFFRVKRKKNLWLNKPKRRKQKLQHSSLVHSVNVVI